MTTEWTPEMTVPDPNEVPMFSVRQTVPPKVERPRTSEARPQWSRYKVKNPVKCDDCMLLLALAHGKAPVARYALFRRKQGATDLLLCEFHAQYRREEDGLEKFKRGKK